MKVKLINYAEERRITRENLIRMRGATQPWLVKQKLANDGETVVSHHKYRGDALMEARRLNREHQTEDYYAEEWDAAKAAMWPVKPRELPADYV